MKPIYYSLWDLQCNRRMATGLNCTTLEDVKRELWDYAEPDREEIFLTNDMNDISLDLLLEVIELQLESSDVPYEDEYAWCTI